MENALLRSIREGQDSGTYLVLDADVADAWPELCISPFGCVPKADADSRFAARLIHDLSFPRGSFVNDASDPDDLPPLTYEHVGELALRIESTKSNKPRVRVKLKRGDVKIAFRHIHGHPRAQELNRVIGAVESRWRLRVSAAHLPGALNVLADLGSRAWDGDQLIRWNDLTCSWSQVPIPPPLRKIYSSTCSPNSTAPSRTPHIGSISSRGDSGARSALGFTSRLPKGQASASSIRSKLSHVRWYHRIYTSCDPQLTPSHGLVLAGMQRVSVFSKTREPVTLEMLQSIMESLDPRKAHHRVIGGAALLGFFFLLRSA
ncbi:hypothetical protein PC129_g15231 [Phytophthora cactorum]|uniref:Uncharacterized protein n=1 Tax=Phytophthora cactorum TaxID=29920 RepID=A0A8T1HPN6_9STRA|nr:hypothetical protein PC129_g15231 [Phytophthora cactorum]